MLKPILSFIIPLYNCESYIARCLDSVFDCGLSEEEKEKYIERCVSFLEKEHESDCFKKVLVTSDSITFLNRISKLSFVYVIPGEVVHVGFTYDASKKTYMKSFLDYYLLSYANKITLVREKSMYHSGFALRAAMLNNTQYNEEWMNV